MTKVSVIIPNWNGEYLLKLCLESLENQSYINTEIILVDNGSVDGSVTYVKSKFPEVKIICLEKNYGFAKAVNMGIKAAKGEYVVLLNNDTEADKNYIEYLVKAAQRLPEAGFIAPKMLNFHKRNIIDSAGDAVCVDGHSYNIGLGEKDGPKYNKDGYVFLATAAGSLFKKEMFTKVGYFDEDYFTYMEDVDLCLRAQIMGFKGWYEPKAVLYHIRKETSSKISSMSEYWHFRNMTQNIIKDYPTKLLLKDFNWLKIILVNIHTFWYMVKQGLIWRAFLAEGYILINLPKLLNKRSKIQKSKIVSDDYFISNVLPKRIIQSKIGG